MKKKKLAITVIFLFVIITLIFNVSAITWYYKPAATINYSSLAVNNSQYLQGYTPFNLPYLTSFTEQDLIALGAINGNLTAWLSTYNSTYASLVSDNVTWNESYANGKYAQYQFSSNNFNGSGYINSGNITSKGNITANGTNHVFGNPAQVSSAATNISVTGYNSNCYLLNNFGGWSKIGICGGLNGELSFRNYGSVKNFIDFSMYRTNFQFRFPTGTDYGFDFYPTDWSVPAIKMSTTNVAHPVADFQWKELTRWSDGSASTSGTVFKSFFLRRNGNFEIEMQTPYINSATKVDGAGSLSDGKYIYMITALDGTKQTTQGRYYYLTVSACSNTCAINLTWNQVQGATGYKIYINTTTFVNASSMNNGLLVTINNGSTTNYLITNSTNSTGSIPDVSTAMSVRISSDNSSFILGNFSIGSSNTPYPLLVNLTDGNGLSAWYLGNISSAGYITRTSIYDKSSGKALNKIKDANDYLVNNKINHSEFYGYVKYKVTDFSKPVYVNVKSNTYNEDGIINGTKINEEITYPYTLYEEGVDLAEEINLLRQGIFEIKQCTANSKDWKEYQECIGKA